MSYKINGQWYEVNDIPFQSLHTKQLLNLMKSARLRDHSNEDTVKQLRASLRVELATRDHVLNKQDSREARRAKHKKDR